MDRLAATAKGYVVVLFGGPEGDWCGLNHCPLGTAEWFPTREAARIYMDTLPSGFEPHLISVTATGTPGPAESHADSSPSWQHRSR